MRKQGLAMMAMALAATVTLSACTGGSAGSAGGTSGSTTSGNASAQTSPSGTDSAAGKATEKADAGEEKSDASAEIEIKDSWQTISLRNRILGQELTFYLPEGEWRESNMNISASTNCYFLSDGASTSVSLLVVPKSYEKDFTEEADGRTLITAGGFPAYEDEYGQIVIHFGDWEKEPNEYFIQAVFSPEDDGAGDDYFEELKDAIIAAPTVSAFDPGFPSDVLVDDSGTMYYPAQISYNGTDIELSEVIMRDASRHVQGIYENEDGVTFTVYSTNRSTSEDSFLQTRAKDEYTERSIGSYQAAERRQTRSVDVFVWMGEAGYKYMCSYSGTDENDAYYDTASALIEALALSGEIHELPEE